VLELIDSFQSDTASRLERLRDAVARLDAAAVKAEAHAMRGSARQMGAESLADLCQAVEASAPQTNWLEVQRQLEQAGLRFAEVRKAMSEYVEARRRARCCTVSEVPGGRGQAAAGRNGVADGAACAAGTATFRTRP
jgi:HPt (histidine-containing phosphotransfer) domain-containing protein